MDTTPNKSRSWNELTRKARSAAAPEVDVRLAVLRALERHEAIPAANMSELLALISARWWLRCGLAACVVLTAAVSYVGWRDLEEVSLVMNFYF